MSPTILMTMDYEEKHNNKVQSAINLHFNNINCCSLALQTIITVSQT